MSKGVRLSRTSGGTRRPLYIKSFQALRHSALAYCARVVRLERADRAHSGSTDTHLRGDDRSGMMRVVRSLALTMAMMLAVATGLGCGGDGDCEGACECSGAECICPSTGDCTIDCGDDCDLQCAGSGNCDFFCGADCLAACTGSGECSVSVGEDSTVRCTGSGDCDVACDGDCVVECPGSGTCIVRCEPGLSCSITNCSGNVQSCPNDIQVCNGSCPE